MKKHLVLIELNEINFDVVRSYIEHGVSLPAFGQLLAGPSVDTFAEDSYELLEPWIQWPSVHLGCDFSKHKIFRLGDIIRCSQAQIFEQVEALGYSVGVLGAMNADNRLVKPAYFIPDPWTSTSSDGGILNEMLTNALIQSVNDNSGGRLAFSSVFSLAINFVVRVPIWKWPSMISYAAGCLKKPWKKSIFLDRFLHEIHMSLFRRCRPNFSTVFFNAGAHLQHHYFHCSKVLFPEGHDLPTWYIGADDPILEIYKQYDKILADYLDNHELDIIVATGLSQKPYEKEQFYYRLKDHHSFLNKLGLDPRKVEPRMTRDMLATFESESKSAEAAKTVSELRLADGTPLFGEVDIRGEELFLTLTVDREITSEDYFISESGKVYFAELVDFVAIKNGEHQSKGFSFFKLKGNLPSGTNDMQVGKLHDYIIDYFHMR